MIKKYYLMEIILVAGIIWVTMLNAKIKNVTNEMTTIINARLANCEDNIETLYSLFQNMNEKVHDIQNKAKEFKGIDALGFDEVFSRMRNEHGPHHLFEWRGDMFTTDIYEERGKNHGKQ